MIVGELQAFKWKMNLLDFDLVPYTANPPFYHPKGVSFTELRVGK
jgi:hypothetical protein